MKTPRRLYTAAKNRGAIEILNDILTYGYWKIRGTQTLEINGWTATFDGDIDHGGARNRQRFDREAPEIKYLLENVETSDVVFDIGANTGLYTCFLAQHAREVVAFEPYPPSVKQLRRNISYNTGNVRVVEKALSDSRGSVMLDQPETDEPGFGTVSIKTGMGEKQVEVEAVAADELIQKGEIPSPNIVKIDVEGAEPLVLRGLEDALATEKCRLLLSEVHLQHQAGLRPGIRDFGMSPDEFFSRIEGLGFDIKERVTHGDAIHLRAEK